VVSSTEYIKLLGPRL